MREKEEPIATRRPPWPQAHTARPSKEKAREKEEQRPQKVRRRKEEEERDGLVGRGEGGVDSGLLPF